MADLRTSYLGLDLRTPLVASASPLTGSLDGLRRLEAAGAAAVVLPSLFEEQLTLEAREVGRLLEGGAGSLSRRSPSTPTTPGRSATWRLSRRPRPRSPSR
jgi:dihydroorotate dehydrogenase (fumarate)